MPIQIVELNAMKAPAGIYPAGTTVDAVLKNPHLFPWRYYLSIVYLSNEEIVDSDDFSGFIGGNREKSHHSETSWTADKVRANVGTTRLLILSEAEEVDP
ncbi:MAG: hypothetical protein NWE89_00780 [Candidatus Bathyarchaeota archaeon]|nr:hypothetical protein [Candidatus Bathyarchaeota archaeon]